MLKLKIDNTEFEAPDGSTILEIAAGAGLSIPTMCHKNGIPHYSSCMVCMVKDKRSGNYIPSCSALAQDGMDIDISGEDVISLRKKSVELLLSEHRAECEAPCKVVCPAGYDIPMMNRYLNARNFDAAIQLSLSQLQSLPFMCPDCPGYCENACRRKKIDTPVSIRNLQIFVAKHIEADINNNNGQPKEKTKKPFASRTGKIEDYELQEWLKECAHDVERFREITHHESAEKESGSCMHCDCRAKDDCRLRELSEAFSIKDPRGKIVNAPIVKKINHKTGLIFENAKCIKCGLCVRVCEDSTNEPALCFIHRGFVSILSEPLTENFDDVLKTKSKNVIDICPTGALSKYK